MRIVFMGTPDFAVPCLEKLLQNGHEIAGVFTQTDKPAGRKQILTPPPVKQAALENNLEVYQPRTLKDSAVYEQIRLLNPEMIVVVAYGKILPKEILAYPEYGCINIHGSLLPKLRGAAPIQWSVINGDEYGGVTSMFMDEGLDTGDMLLSARTKIGENETSGELYDRLSVLGAALLIETVDGLRNGTLERKKQDDALSTYAPLLNKEISKIDWNESAAAVHNKIRGLNPWPAAVTEFGGKKVKLFLSVLAGKYTGQCGEVVENKKRLVVCCGDGNAVEITELQAEGKKRNTARDFLSGNDIPLGTILGR